MAESVLDKNNEYAFTEKQKITIIQKKTEKELLQSIAYDVDGIKGYVSFMAVVLAIQIAVVTIIGLAIVFNVH